MESGPEARTLPEEATGEVRTLEQETTGMLKTQGFATTTGQDYEVALCSLIFLRGLRITSDFFIACNHALYDKFDDVVLFYRLEGDQGHEYRAILVQAKHRNKYTEKKLTKSNPFNLKEYLDSFNKIRNLWERPVKVESRELKLKDVKLVLYTNTGCDVGEAAVDVTDLPEVQHLKDFLNTGRGRLLRIPEAQGVGLPQGPDTSDFLRHLILCTEQMTAKTADEFLEEELCKVFRLTSLDDARILNRKFKFVVKAWWSEEGTVHYLTAKSEEWKTVLQMQVESLNSDIINIDRLLNLGFTSVSLKELDVVHRHMKMTCVSVRDEYQATVTRARLFRARRNSLVLDGKYIEYHGAEVEALWGKSVCPCLVLDLCNYSLEEKSELLQELQVAVQSGAGRHLVVIAKEQTQGDGWEVLEPLTTWYVLDEATQERLLSVNVQLQGNAVVALRDVVGSYISDVMTDKLIHSVCTCETAIKLGEAMPAPLEYYVPRSLQRRSYKTINFDSLQNTDTLIFPTNFSYFTKLTLSERFKSLSPSDLKRTDKIEGPIIVSGTSFNFKINNLCYTFRVRGLRGDVQSEGFTGDVTEFIPFTWLCEDKVVIVEGLPGVGKSSFVTAMCFSVKEQFPEAWVLRVDMGRHSGFIKGRQFRERRDVKDFLLQAVTKDLHTLERDLLEHSLTVTGNVFLFLDAFDEISPDFTTKCCDLLKGIARTVMFRQMVVSTRPVTTKDVQEALDTDPFTLPVFSRQEQTLFLQQFSVTSGKNVDRNLIYSLRQSAGPVLEIPLLCRMAAEILMHRKDIILFKCLDPWRRVLLYRLFVDQSVKDRLAKKFGLDASVLGVKTLLEFNQMHHLQNLQGLAVRMLMPVEKFSKLNVSTEVPQEKLGLVVNTAGTVAFEHQTFAEYFLGCWLSEHWRECPQQVLRDVLLQDGFQFVLATLSWSLFEDFPLHMAVAQGDEGSVRALLSPGTTDRGGRSPLHVAAMTQGKNREVWDLLVASGEDLNKKDDVLGKTAVKYAEVTRKWEFVDLMHEKGATLGDLKFVQDLKEAKEVLIYSVQKDLSSLVRYIFGLHKGLRRDMRDARDDTLSHVAISNNSLSVMKILFKRDQFVNLNNAVRRTPLHTATRRNYLEAVRLLIVHGADTNIKDEDGNTALMEAAREGHLKVVKLLIENGADPNIKNKYGNSALMLAACEGNLDVVKFLIENGADPNIKDEDGNTDLMRAAWQGQLEVVKFLTEKGADLNIKNKYGNTALTLAAEGGHMEVVKFLKQNGADPNIKNEFANTALTLAAWQGHLEVVRFLIENGADPNIKNKYADTALTLASLKDHMEVVKFLIENGADHSIKYNGEDTVLTWAERAGHLEVVKLLTENGADPHIKNEDGNTALTLGAWKGHLEVVKSLIENGADPNIKNEDGDTALTVAALKGHMEVVKILIEMGADPNVQNEYGNTALIRAALIGQLEVVKFLIENGADANIRNEDGNTALIRAALIGQLEVVKFLTVNGADPNIKNEYGDTALTVAAREGHLQIVKFVIEHRADPHIKNEVGNTALTLGALKGHMEVVKFLIENGADPTIENKGGDTALALAVHKGHVEVVKFLIENGADPNVQNEYGMTALITSAFIGQLEVVKLLIENGADPNIKNEYGDTALTVAALKGYQEIVKFLIENGADPNIKNEDGDTALTLAVLKGYLEVVKLLIENGANPNVKNDEGNTALLLALREGHLEVVKLLTENGSDPNINDEDGDMPFTVAAREGHLKILNLFIDTHERQSVCRRKEKKKLSCLLQ